MSLKCPLSATYTSIKSTTTITAPSHPPKPTQTARLPPPSILRLSHIKHPHLGAPPLLAEDLGEGGGVFVVQRDEIGHVVLEVQLGPGRPPLLFLSPGGGTRRRAKKQDMEVVEKVERGVNLTY